MRPDQRPTYSDHDLCKHAADFARCRPGLTWDEAVEKARENLRACGYDPEPAASSSPAPASS